MNSISAGERITSAEQIILAARELARGGRKKMVAVAGASDVAVLGALASANADGILDATLFGDRDKIKQAADGGQVDISKFNIVHSDNPGRAIHDAVKMADEGRADVIMKGFVSTSALLRGVLSKEFGLRVKETISHSAVLDIPGYHKLLQMTDGGMVVRPNREQKIQIMENAIMIARALHLKPVKVAFSGAVDGRHDDMPQTLETAELIETISRLNLENVKVEGPMTFDTATSAEIAKTKKVFNTVAGDADIYLVNTIEECNIIAKALINFADTVFAGVIVGAGVPISLVSRTDTMTNKKASVSVACLIAEYYQAAGKAGGGR